MSIRIHPAKLFAALLIFAVCFAAAAIQVYAISDPQATGRITETDGVNIRSSYSTSSSIAGALPYNTYFTVEKEKYTVSGSSARTDIWYKISSSWGNGYIRSDLASISYSFGEGTITTAAPYRKGPGTAFSSMGKVAKGTKVKVALKAETASGSAWYKIYYNNAYYYVSANYLTVTDAGAGSTVGGGSGGGSGGGTSTGGGALSDAEFERMLTAEQFPESYKPYLRAVHKNHPNWRFRAKHLAFTWKDALDKQCANSNANLITRNFADGYKSVQKGDYDFDAHAYIGKDGASWVSASRQAVAYYMDPRNWLDEVSLFMFEPNSYDPTYQTEALVKRILEPTALPASAAKYYIQAAQQTYNGANYVISPIYLATKTRQELGSSDFMINGDEFEYGGKTFSGYYNTYNIGAVDSPDGSAAIKGLVFAAGGSNKSETSYLRPWNSLEKAIKGGAIYIGDTFMARNQDTSYYERFNVVNGLSSIGTYQYATAVFAAATQSSLIHTNYDDFNVLDESFTFEIPVYQNMPQDAAEKPGAGSNNCYLDNITVSAGGKKLAFTSGFDRFTSNYTVKSPVDSSVNKLTITTTKNDDAAKVTISGNNLSAGENKITVKVTSPSGKEVKRYYIKVTKEKDDGSGGSSNGGSSNEKLIAGVQATTIKASSVLGEGYIQINWEKSAGYKVDYFQVYRSTTSGEYGDEPFFTTADGTKNSYKNNKDLVDGTRYYYKVRGVRVIDGKTYYTNWSGQANRIYKKPEVTSTNDSLIAGVKATTIKASSVLGSGYITVKWTKSKGYKVDAFEIYRSTKSGSYGSKPFFTTPNGNWASFKNTGSLKKGTRYYYKIRGVRTIDGRKYYTEWSNQANRIYK